MKIKLFLWLFWGLTAVIGITGLCLAETNDSEYSLTTPVITQGNVINDSYFNGPITLESDFVAPLFSRLNLIPYYSLDGGTTWNPANLADKSLTLNRNDPVMPTPPATGSFLYSLGRKTAFLPDQSFITVWAELKYTGKTSNWFNFAATIYGQHYDLNGNPVGGQLNITGPFYLNTQTYPQFSQNQFNLELEYDVAAISKGGFTVIWTSSGACDQPQAGSGNDYNIYGRCFNAIGQPLTNKFKINTTVSPVCSAPSLASIPGKGFVAYWKCSGSVNSYYGRLFDPEGLPIGADFFISNNVSFPVKCAGVPDGGFITAAVSSSANKIEISHYDALGRLIKVALGPDVNIMYSRPERNGSVYDDVLAAYKFDLTTLADGGYVIDWTELEWSISNDKECHTELVWHGFPLFVWLPEEKCNYYSVGHSGNYYMYAQQFNQNDIAVQGKVTVYSSATKIELIGSQGLANGNFMLGFTNTATSNRITAKMFPAINQTPIALPIAIPSSYSALGNFNVAPDGRILISSDFYQPNQLKVTDEVLYFNNLKAMTAGNISPDYDITACFKLVDPTTGQQWVSPARSYNYANPDDGKNGSIDYQYGFTNLTFSTIQINLPVGRYQSLQLYQRTAPLAGGTAGQYGEWQKLGIQTTLTTDFDAVLRDGLCYQFKCAITNIAGMTYEYLSDQMIGCDQVPPLLEISNQTNNNGVLQFNITKSDAGSGLDGAEYCLNLGDPVTITGDTVTISLIEGGNRIDVIARDKAGNQNRQTLFVTSEKIQQQISINGITEGVIYGDEAIFNYYSTCALTGLLIYLDGEPVSGCQISVDGIPAANLDGVENGNHQIIIQGTNAEGAMVVTRLETMNGQFSLNLTGTTEGTHSLTVKGQDVTGQTITRTVNFIHNKNALTLTLLMPGNSLVYGQNTIDIQYWSSEPLGNLRYQLNGGPVVNGLHLADLADGAYELTLIGDAADGQSVIATQDFTVKQAFPILKVTSPLSNQVCTGNQVEVQFTSNVPVTYQLEDQSGTITSGQAITLPRQDGVYILTLTATHPVSGNIARQNIRLIVDRVALAFELYSPQSGMYATGDIPINYHANKTLQNVNMILNGVAVETLSQLKPGQYTFALTASDQAGQMIRTSVNFTVNSLEIVNPKPGAQIISTSNPPTVDFQYAANGPFQSLTQQLNQGEQQLITAPAGTNIPLTAEPGANELTLRGYLNEFHISKRVDFKVGRKNLTVDSSSINYSYIPIGTGGLGFYVTVTLKVMNTGDIDINEPFQVRFDQINSQGRVHTIWRDISGLAAGRNVQVTLDPFPGTFNDVLMVTADPEAQLAGEWPGDNSCRIQFSTAQITGVASTLPDTNCYLTDISLFNVMEVTTAGPVAKVEFQVGNKVFVGYALGNSFRSIVDMGLLTPEQNWVRIVAYGSNGVILDSRLYRFNVKRINNNPASLRFPWASYEEAGTNQIIMKNVDLKNLAQMWLQTVQSALFNLPTAIPILDSGNKVTYTVFSISDTKSESYNTVALGDAPLVGGTYRVGNGKGHILITSVDLAAGTAENIGFIPILDDGAHYGLTIHNIWQYIFDQLNTYLNQYIQDLNVEQVFADTLFSTSSLYGTHFGDLFLFYYDIGESSTSVPGLLGVYFQGLIDISIQQNLKINAPVINFDYGFTNVEPCRVMIEDGFSVNITGRADFYLKVDTVLSGNTPSASASVIGLIGLNDGAAGFLVNLMLGNTFNLPMFVVGDFKLNPVGFSVPLHFSADASFKLDNGLFVSGHVHFDKSTDLDQQIGQGDLTLYFPWFGWGIGADVKARLRITGTSKDDLVLVYKYPTPSGEEPFQVTEFSYTNGYSLFVVDYRYKISIGWPISITIKSGWENYYRNEQPYTAGTYYTDEQVQQALGN